MFDDRLFRPYVEATSASRSRAPLYFQLFSSLKSMILEGVLGYGEQVPTEEQLASLFSVSRITSKRALDELASEGLVERAGGASMSSIATAPARAGAPHRHAAGNREHGAQLPGRNP